MLKPTVFFFFGLFLLASGAAQAQKTKTLTAKTPDNVSGKWVGSFKSTLPCDLVIYLNHYSDYISGVCETDCSGGRAKATMKGIYDRKHNYYLLSEEAILDSVNKAGYYFCLAERYEMHLNEAGDELTGYFVARKCGGDTVRLTLKRELELPKLELTTLYFEPRSASLNKTHYKALKEMSDALKANPKLRVEIMGFTDFSANFDKLLPLAIKRAEVVKRYLTTNGIPIERMVVTGYGYQMPEAAAKEYEAKNSPYNRRVEFKLME